MGRLKTPTQTADVTGLLLNGIDLVLPDKKKISKRIMKKLEEGWGSCAVPGQFDSSKKRIEEYLLQKCFKLQK
ncbi:hypothetical protein [Pedobacter miscanthi]|jgi:hypothetical protein|uniref:Uncharacterized protein n=1 Tax=Pedobacter miscanthi TaxID=2259170 RepID=A0A366L0R2_9SPHI|nr:hypothetical protein [Pedobacter miscanthi]RBQ06742.1 hypothetical protein DRW42_13260 [Pedobacter miscanthi]